MVVNADVNEQILLLDVSFCYIHTVNLSIVRLNILDSKCDVNRQILLLDVSFCISAQLLRHVFFR
jgi:hypothetical protein